MGGVNVEMCVEGVNVGWVERSFRMQDYRRASRRWVEELHKRILYTEYCTYVGQTCVPALITRSTLSGAPTVCSWLLDVWT